MAELTFKKATRERLYARVALLGPAGSGKSYTALRLAFALAGDGRVAAIDTEHRSLSKYVGEAPDGAAWDFDVLELESFSPDKYIEGIRAAEQAGYVVLIIDGLSHAWAGKDGILEFVDEVARRAAARRGSTPNNYTAWRDATPKHNELVEAILAAKIDLIATMRVKMDYVQEKDESGKTVIRKIGLQPVQRDGLEYEFDLIGDMSMDASSSGVNTLVVGKTRCSALRGKVFDNPGREMAVILKDWLDVGERGEDGGRATGAVSPPPKTASGNGDGVPVAKPTGFPTWSEKAKRAFWVTMRDLGVSHDAIHTAFGVESMNDCSLTQPQAAEMVRVLKYGLQDCGLPLQGVYDALEVSAIHKWQGGEKAGKERIDTQIAYLQDREDEAEGTEGGPGDEQALPF